MYRYAETYTLNELYTEKSRRKLGWPYYLTGFHIYKHKSGAEFMLNGPLDYTFSHLKRSLVICKVECKNICASGTQDGQEVVVARKMRVVEELK